MKNYSVFSKEYETLFEENLTSFCRNIKKTNNPKYINKEYSLFFPSCGTDKKEEVDFLIYGQATKEWKPIFRVIDSKFSSLVQSAKEFSNTYYPRENSPLDWVNKIWNEKMCRSFFWNVTYKLINCYKKGLKNIPAQKEDWLYKDDWYNNMIWSNLMKIAPTSERRNPNEEEWDAQLEFSKKLFQSEIIEVKPKYVILLTNWGWAKDFLEDKEFSIEKSENDFIEAYGNFGKTKIIVTKRPFVGNNEECVNQILELIK